MKASGFLLLLIPLLAFAEGDPVPDVIDPLPSMTRGRSR